MSDATWLASPATNLFFDGRNWSTGSAPSGTATFAASNTTDISVERSTTLAELLFNAGAPAYTFDVTADLTLNGAGIVDNSSNAPTIDVAAGMLTVSNSTGSSATGDATIVTSGSGGMYLAGSVNTASTSRLELGAGTILGVGPDPYQAVGSIEGAGDIEMDSPGTLVVGYNNLSTTFGGIIYTNLPSPSHGGQPAVEKVGFGTWTVTGEFSIGSVTVDAGTLRLGAGGSLLAFSALILSGGAFDIGANNQTLGTISATAGSLKLGGGTLTDASGLTAGSGMQLSGFGGVQATVDGSGSLIATGGTLDFKGTVDGSAASAIHVGNASGTVLKFDSTVGSNAINPVVTFDGGTSLLDLSSTTLASFHGVIAAFANGEGIKIANAASAAVDASGHIVTVFDSGHNSLGTLSFSSSYTAGSFTVTNQILQTTNSLGYSTAVGGVYVDLAAQFTEHAPAGQGWSGGPGSVTPVSIEHFSGIQNVTGSPFDDLLVGGTSSCTLSGGAGNDLIYGNISQATADNMSQLTLDGGTGNNALYGSSAFNTFIGGDAGGGFNQMWGAASKMAGGSGFANNTLSFAATPSGQSVYVDLLNGHNAYVNSGSQTNGTYTLEDAISNVPNVIGSSGGDVIIADNGVDRITGGAGADQLYAGSGAGSQDTFVYTAYGDSNLVAGYDTIVGFKAGTDKIDFTALHSDASHLLIQTAGTSSSVYLEATPGNFNPNTDLAMNVLTSAPGGLHGSDFVF
jgi:hypothetical protein